MLLTIGIVEVEIMDDLSVLKDTRVVSYAYTGRFKLFLVVGKGDKEDAVIVGR